MRDRGRQIAISDEDISEFMYVIQRYAQEHPILIDKYLMGVEVEVDAVCDGAVSYTHLAAFLYLPFFIKAAASSQE